MRRPRGRLRAAATDALDPVFLVGRDLPRQGQSAIKAQVRDRHKERLISVLLTKIEFAQDPAFVARIVDLRDLAPGRQVKSWRLLLQLGQHGWRRHGRERQGRFEVGHEQVSRQPHASAVQLWSPWLPAGDVLQEKGSCLRSTHSSAERLMSEVNAFIGLDVHKDTISVAVAEAGRGGGGWTGPWADVRSQSEAALRRIVIMGRKIPA